MICEILRALKSWQADHPTGAKKATYLKKCVYRAAVKYLKDEQDRLDNEIYAGDTIDIPRLRSAKAPAERKIILGGAIKARRGVLLESPEECQVQHAYYPAIYPINSTNGQGPASTKPLDYDGGTSGLALSLSHRPDTVPLRSHHETKGSLLSCIQRISRACINQCSSVPEWDWEQEARANRAFVEAHKGRPDYVILANELEKRTAAASVQKQYNDPTKHLLKSLLLTEPIANPFLTELQFEALYRCDVLGKSMSQAAREIGTSENNIKSALRRAREGARSRGADHLTPISENEWLWNPSSNPQPAKTVPSGYSAFKTRGHLWALVCQYLDLRNILTQRSFHPPRGLPPRVRLGIDAYNRWVTLPELILRPAGRITYPSIAPEDRTRPIDRIPLLDKVAPPLRRLAWRFQGDGDGQIGISIPCPREYRRGPGLEAFRGWYRRSTISPYKSAGRGVSAPKLLAARLGGQPMEDPCSGNSVPGPAPYDLGPRIAQWREYLSDAPIGGTLGTPPRVPNSVWYQIRRDHSYKYLCERETVASDMSGFRPFNRLHK